MPNLTPLLLKALARIEAPGPLGEISLSSTSKKVPLFNKQKLTPSSLLDDKKKPGLLEKQLRAAKKLIMTPPFQKSLKNRGNQITEVKLAFRGEIASWTICCIPQELPAPVATA